MSEHNTDSAQFSSRIFFLGGNTCTIWYDELSMKGQGVSVAQMEPTDLHGFLFGEWPRRSDDGKKAEDFP